MSDSLLARLARSPNLSVVRLPAAPANGSSPRVPADARPAIGRPGWEAGALALREAARRRSTYVVVADDPLADVAASWHAMWDVSAGPAGAAAFEERAAEALAAWQDKQFELPDYYLVVAPSQPEGTGPSLYLGPLRAARPRRIAVTLPGGTGTGDGEAESARLLDALRALEHGPWWPPLSELIDRARHFYAGGLAETQQPPA